MVLPKIQDLRNLSDQEVEDQIQALKRQLFELRMQKATRQTVKPHLFKQTRHQLAQIMTIERERKAVGQVAAQNPVVLEEVGDRGS